MKTALDLPDDLMRELKIRAAQQGRKLKEVIAELLRVGMNATVEAPAEQSAVIVRDAVTGLPTILCSRTPAPAERLTPDRLAEILLDQEVEWNLEAR